MEDNIVYTILILALFLLPTSVLITTSLDCTYCQQALCEENTMEDPGLQAYFVKKYCTYEADLSPLILYYPFILLVIATVLIMVDQPFVLKLFKSVSLEEMWRVVVVESEESHHIQRQRLQHAMSVSSSGYFISSNSSP